MLRLFKISICFVRRPSWTWCICFLFNRSNYRYLCIVWYWRGPLCTNNNDNSNNSVASSGGPCWWSKRDQMGSAWKITCVVLWWSQCLCLATWPASKQSLHSFLVTLWCINYSGPVQCTVSVITQKRSILFDGHRRDLQLLPPMSSSVPMDDGVTFYITQSDISVFLGTS